MEKNKSGKIIEPGAGGGFRFSLFVQGLTEKVTLEKRFKSYAEASHA